MGGGQTPTDRQRPSWEGKEENRLIKKKNNKYQWIIIKIYLIAYTCVSLTVHTFGPVEFYQIN